MLRRLIGLVGLAALAVSGMAQPQKFSQRAQNIRAGIVILAASKYTVNSVPQSAGPFALYNLDSNTSVKPTGWNFYNPYAPTTVTQAIYNRWSSINPGGAEAVGQHIGKMNGPYWEVFLSQMSDQQMGNYDLLIVNPVQTASLNPLEQQRLRRFVDNGGVLWIDPAGMSSIDAYNNFPFPFQPFNTAITNEQTDFSNPVMGAVQSLTPNDINVMDTAVAGGTGYALGPVTLPGNLANICGGNIADFNRLQVASTVGGNNFPVVAIGHIGDGAVVITSLGASLELNRTVTATAYTGAASNFAYTALPPNLGRDGIAAAKLAVNMVGMMDESRQQGAGSRKTSSSAIDLNPPLLNCATIPDPNGTFAGQLNSVGMSQSTPALYKGFLVTTVGNTVQVYNANPSINVGGGGNPDGGVPLYELGASYDLIWQSVPLQGPLSAPVCTQVQGSNPNSPQDLVLVVDGNGHLDVFNLTPRNPNGTLAGSTPGNGFPYIYSLAPPNGNATVDNALTGTAMAPTVSEGIAYVTDTVSVNGFHGRVWQVDLLNGTYVTSVSATSTTPQFAYGGATHPDGQNIPEFSAGATVGYIPIQDNSGGVDKVLYAPFAPNSTIGFSSAGVMSLWIGSRGEVPTSYDVNGNLLQVFTRASNHGGAPIYLGAGSLGPKITLIDINGNPLPASIMSSYFNGSVTNGLNGEIDFGLTQASLPPTAAGVRVDYTLDWGNTGPGANPMGIQRGYLCMPDVANNPTRYLNGSVALSPQGTFYVVNSEEGGTPYTLDPSAVGGGLYGFRELAPGTFVCVSRYELYQPYQMVINQTQVVADKVGVLADNDFLISFMAAQSPFVGNLLAQGMTNYEIKGGPSIRNGQVFVTATATKGGIVPVTIVMAFNAEPQPATFVVGNLAAGATILQPDFALSTNQAAPENESTIPSSGSNTGGAPTAATGYVYDSTSGVITFPNLMTTNQSGPIKNCLSLSQPIIIHTSGSTDQVIYPDSIGGAVWSPLQWFAVIDGSYPTGGTPLVTGNTVSVSLDSFLPYFLQNGVGAGSPTLSGMVNSFNAQIPSSSLHTIGAKPWLSQLWMLDPVGAGFIGDPNVTWPQAASVTSFNDYIIKLNQTVLGSSATAGFAFGIVGGDNDLVAWGNNGLYTFDKSNFLICDEGRIIQMDPSGNPIWATNVTASTGQSAINASGNVKTMVRPTHAYLQNQSSVLFADAGANRVALSDTNGVETRSITGFQLDPTIVPSGYNTGESLSLAAPRDVAYYTTYTQMSGATNLVTMGDGETGNNVEYWQHYLIADSGNNRLIEIIDRFYYNPSNGLVGQPVTVNNVPQLGVLLWHSPAAVSGKAYSYNSISRINVPDNNGGHFVYVAGIGGSLPTPVGLGLQPYASNPIAEAQDGSGGVVIFDPTNLSGPQVFNSITTPNVLTDAFWDPTSGAFDTLINQNTAIGMQTAVERQGGTHRLTDVNSVTAKMINVGGTPLMYIMIADATGVYEVNYNPQTPAAGISNVDWEITNEAFCAIQQTTFNGNLVAAGTNSQQLRATFARRLNSGDILIVNGYYGNAQSGVPFTGEVMQINGAAYNPIATNLGFTSSSITLDLRSAGTTAYRGLDMPVFADRE